MREKLTTGGCGLE